MKVLYLQSRRDRPIHLALWIPDRAEFQSEAWVTGKYRPICCEIADGWGWVTKFDPHFATTPLCKHCHGVMSDLLEATAVVQERESVKTP